MAIEGERHPKTHSAHRVEADAVDEAKAPLPRDQQGSSTCCVGDGVHPINVCNREHVLLEGADSLDGQAPLGQGKGLHEDVLVQTRDAS